MKIFWKLFWIRREFRPFLIIFVILSAALIFGGYKYRVLGKEYASTKIALQEKISGFEKNIVQIEFEKTSLNDALNAERDRNAAFKAQIDEISDTVGTLEKLSQTDPELLKKYSKIYFLNEHYVPQKLADIDQKYVSNEKPQQINFDVQPFLRKLLESADKDGLRLEIISGFRSFGVQAALKSNYNVVYGVGTANQFSADQGYSEHQLGTAVDFTNSAIGTDFEKFKNTDEYDWLMKNAYRYGFILSYPENNLYYQYEPWHWRFVGVKLAKKLHRDNVNFYDFSQREIDEYLISLFD